MPLTKEQLLIPRYKVIADYPFCPFEVGVILYVAEDGELYSDVAGYAPSKWIVNESEVSQWPHLFQLLPWWSDRKIEDMPEYMESHSGVYKITYFNNCQFDCNDGNGAWYINENVMHYFQPATEEEYINQKQQ